MNRRGWLLLCVAALASGPPAVGASGRCYNTAPAAPGSVATCAVAGAGRYAVAAADQWELRVYQGAICTGSAADIDTARTRTGRTPSAGIIDFGDEPRCVALRLTGAGAMLIDAEAVP